VGDDPMPLVSGCHRAFYRGRLTAVIVFETAAP
jgi:hypothetical protein